MKKPNRKVVSLPPYGTIWRPVTIVAKGRLTRR